MMYLILTINYILTFNLIFRYYQSNDTQNINSIFNCINYCLNVDLPTLEKEKEEKKDIQKENLLNKISLILTDFGEMEKSPQENQDLGILFFNQNKF